MNFLDTLKLYFTKIVSGILFWTLLITIGFAFYIDSLFPKYNISIKKTTFANEARVIFADLNGDSVSEKIEFKGKLIYKSIAFFDINDFLFFNYNFLKDVPTTTFENFLIKDYDKNGAKELYVITQKADSVFIMTFICNQQNKITIKEKFVTTISKNFKNEYDFDGYFMFGENDFNNDNFNEIHISIVAGYSYSPRMIYAYDVKNDTIYKSAKDGIFLTPKFIKSKPNNEPFVIAGSIAVGNFDKKFDSIPLHDTSAWIKVLNNKLQYVFTPIEIEGKGSTIFSKYVEINEIPYLCVFKNNMRENHIQEIFLYTFTGELVRKIEQIDMGYKDVTFIDNYFEEPTNNLLFADKNNFAYFANSDFTEIEKLQIPFSESENCKSYFFYDLDNCGEKEILFIGINEIVVFRNNFSYPCKLHVSTLTYRYLSEFKNDNEQGICLQAGEVLHFLSYKKNDKFFIKYLLIAGFFSFLYFFLNFIQKIRSQQLENESIRLNEIVRLRTQEIFQQKEEIETQTEYLKSLVEKLKYLDQYKQDLTSMLVHDLKNPLNFIINQNEHNQTGQVGMQILQMVVNMLDVQKFEETKMQLNIEKHNLNKTIHKAVKQINYLLEQKNITLLNYTNTYIETLYDADIMERVFVNLLSNAIKYSPQGENIIIKSQFIVENNNNFILIEITDKGKGIPEDFIPKIFDKFSQNEAKSLGIAHSTGLGLTFCRYGIEAHGGKIMVSSKLGEGSVFTFTLPAEKLSISQNEELQVIKKSSKEFFLTYDEKLYLNSYINELKKIEFYSLTELMNVLNTIDSSFGKNIEAWKKAVAHSIENFDEQQFNHLITINNETE